MKNPSITLGSLMRVLAMSVIILAIRGGYHRAEAQEQEVVLFAESFDDGQTQGWDLEPGDCILFHALTIHAASDSNKEASTSSIA